MTTTQTMRVENKDREKMEELLRHSNCDWQINCNISDNYVDVIWTFPSIEEKKNLHPNTIEYLERLEKRIDRLEGRSCHWKPYGIS